MNRQSSFDLGGENGVLEALWEDGERRFCRVRRNGTDGAPHERIAVLSASEHQTPASISRLAHEYALRDYLDGAWSLRPVELVRELGRTMLFVEYTGGEPLDRLINEPMEIRQFLRIATALPVALGRLHGSGIVHKDIKPANVVINPATHQVWLTGFGVASRLPRERQAPEPPEFTSA